MGLRLAVSAVLFVPEKYQKRDLENDAYGKVGYELKVPHILKKKKKKETRIFVSLVCLVCRKRSRTHSWTRARETQRCVCVCVPEFEARFSLGLGLVEERGRRALPAQVIAYHKTVLDSYPTVYVSVRFELLDSSTDSSARPVALQNFGKDRHKSLDASLTHSQTTNENCEIANCDTDRRGPA